MSYCTSQIVQLAGEIYTGIGAPPALSVGAISGWITSSSTIGTLNNRLTTSFTISGVEPCIGGGFGDAEASILSLTYQCDYYFGRSVAIMAGGDTLDWSTMRDGDTTISRESTVKRSKAYLEISKDLKGDLNIAVANWKLGQSIPAMVDSSSSYSWPSP